MGNNIYLVVLRKSSNGGKIFRLLSVKAYDSRF